MVSKAAILTNFVNIDLLLCYLNKETVNHYNGNHQETNRDETMKHKVSSLMYRKVCRNSTIAVHETKKNMRRFVISEGSLLHQQMKYMSERPFAVHASLTLDLHRITTAYHESVQCSSVRTYCDRWQGACQLVVLYKLEKIGMVVFYGNM